MARTDLTTQVSSRLGTVLSYAAVSAANDAMFVNTGVEEVIIKTGATATVNIVFETPITVLSEALAVADEVTTLIASSDGLFGPFPTGVFNQPSGADVGKVYINVDQAVTIAVIKPGSAS